MIRSQVVTMSQLNTSHTEITKSHRMRTHNEPRVVCLRVTSEPTVTPRRSRRHGMVATVWDDTTVYEREYAG